MMKTTIKKLITCMVLALFLLSLGSVSALEFTQSDAITLSAANGPFTDKVVNNDYIYKIEVKVPTAHHNLSYDVTYTLNVLTGEIISAFYPSNWQVGNYLRIPETLAGYPVKSIGPEVFRDKDTLLEVILPETIESIGEYAFADCNNLYVVKMNNPQNSRLKTIKDRAFAGSQVTFTVPLYEGLEYIGAGAFSEIKLDGHITLPDSVSYIGEGAFYKITEMTGVTLPESLTRLGDSAFSNCTGITSVEIPEELSDIGHNAFYKTPWLENYDAEFVVEGDYVLIDYNGTDEEVTLPNNILHLGDGVFAGHAITGITLNSRLKTIGKGAFENCSKLTSVTFSENVTTMGDNAFAGCELLSEITIPNSVTSLGEGIFKECKKLTSATLPQNITEIPPYTFYKTKIASWDFSNIKKIGTFAFSSSAFTGELTLESPMEYVGISAFSGTKITSLTITDNVFLADNAFLGCSNLTQVNIDSSVKKIGEYVLAQTPWYTSASSAEYLIVGAGILLHHTQQNPGETVLVPNTVKTVAPSAFAATEAYAKIVLPDSVTYLGDYAMRYCRAEEVVLPNTITEMGIGVFQNSIVNKVIWPKNYTVVPDYTFYNSHLAVFDLSKITVIGDYAFNNNYYNAPVIGSSIEEIGDFAFRGGKITLHHLPAKMGTFPFSNRDTTNWNVYPEFHVDPDVFPYNAKEDYVVLPAWIDYEVFIDIQPRITEINEDYMLVKFDHFPPKVLGVLYGSSGYIGSEKLSWVDESTIKMTGVTEYIGQSLKFEEHYSGHITFHFLPITISGVGRSEASLTADDILLQNTPRAVQDLGTHFLARCTPQSANTVLYYLSSNQGETFRMYNDEACTQVTNPSDRNYPGTVNQYLGRIDVSPSSTTAYVQVTSENGQNQNVYKIIFEFYYKAATPTFDVTQEMFKNSMNVTMSCETQGAQIYYTTDGTTPSDTNGTRYTGAVTITETTTFKAVAYSSYKRISDVATKSYTATHDMTLDSAIPDSDSVRITVSPVYALYRTGIDVMLSTNNTTWAKKDTVRLLPGSEWFTLTDLNPNTTYYCKLSVPDTEITSNVLSFTTSSKDAASGYSYDRNGYITGVPDGLDRYEIPESIGDTTIIGIAPYACQYVYGTVVIPKTVTDVSAQGMSTGIRFTVPDDHTTLSADGGSLYSKDFKTLIRVGRPEDGGKGENTIFYLPASVETVGDYAICDTYYADVDLGSTVKTLGSNAFYSGYGMKVLRIPASVTNIGKNMVSMGNAAVVFLGNFPTCHQEAFGDNVTLYSAKSAGTLNGKTVLKTSNPNNHAFFSVPNINGSSVSATLLCDTVLSENAMALCRVTYENGKQDIFSMPYEEWRTDYCFYTDSTVESAKVFLIDMVSLKPLATEVSWNR